MEKVKEFIPPYIPGMEMTLKAARINKGLKTKDVCTKLNISIDVLYNWETARSFPNPKQIKQLQSLYGVNYNNIIFYKRNTAIQ